MRPVYVVVTGPPGSGKSTLAHELARLLELPLLAKDDYKQQLLDDEPARSVEESREAGRKAVQAMLTAARAAEQGVLDSVWVDRDRALEDLAALNATSGVVEVFCRCDIDTMRRRYRDRAPTRGPGHFDEQRDDEELWPAFALDPLAGEWPVVEVDTSSPVDTAALAARLTRTRSRR